MILFLFGQAEAIDPAHGWVVQPVTAGGGGVEWIQILGNFGVAVACLVALGLAIWRGMIFLANHVAKPLAERHIRFLDDLTTATSTQAQALQTMTMQQTKMLESIEHLMEKQDALFKAMTDRLDADERRVRK